MTSELGNRLFNWLFSSCPVDEHAKRWIDERFRWLTDEFGSDLLIDSPTVTPSDEFFPDQYEATEEGAEQLINRVVDLMRVPRSILEISFFRGDSRTLLVNEQGHDIPTSAAGWYSEDENKMRIQLNRADLDSPMNLVGTVAHECAHARLLGENRISPDIFDNELLTDLTVVFHGLGIFLANVPRNWHADNKTWPGTNAIRPEYMSLPMFGYAMALRCQLRFEDSPKWTKYLNGHARAEFKQAMRFFKKQAK